MLLNNFFIPSLLCILVQCVVSQMNSPFVLTETVPASPNAKKLIFLTRNGVIDSPNLELEKNRLSSNVVTRFGNRLHRIRILNNRRPNYQVPSRIHITYLRPVQRFKPSGAVPLSILPTHAVHTERPPLSIKTSAPTPKPFTNLGGLNIEVTSALPHLQTTIKTGNDDDYDYDIDVREDQF